MGRRLISKEEQIKRLEQEVRESCREALCKRIYSILYPAGVLSVENFKCIKSAMEILILTMDSISNQAIMVKDDVTSGYYETYSKSDITVQSICNSLEGLDSGIKCNDEVKSAIVALLNEWQMKWIVYGLKKANILGIMSDKCKVKTVEMGDVTRIYIEK